LKAVMREVAGSLLNLSSQGYYNFEKFISNNLTAFNASKLPDYPKYLEGHEEEIKPVFFQYAFTQYNYLLVLSGLMEASFISDAKPPFDIGLCYMDFDYEDYLKDIHMEAYKMGVYDFDYYLLKNDNAIEVETIDPFSA
ncbi:MAG: hypothetical protein K5694_04425, partial [Bacilli bacterium]|nr:hypothetical protein [Bacilli bacterium]